MQPVRSTLEILAYKVLNRDVDQTWVDWAMEMLMANYESEHIVILAGITFPENQFYLQELARKVLGELQLDYSDKSSVLDNYIIYLVEQALIGKESYESVLNKIQIIYCELNYEELLTDFMLLYWAKYDLKYGENQWYWEGANRDNIDQIIKDYFIEWLIAH